MKRINKNLLLVFIFIAQQIIYFDLVVVYADQNQDSIKQSSNIQAAEYFIDVDPGKGNGIPIPVVDDSFNSLAESILSKLNISNLAGRSHYIFIRFKNSEGVWGETRGFLINTATQQLERYIISAECFFDADPGFGKGVPLTCKDGQFDEKIEELEMTGIETSHLIIGQHKVYVRAQASDGAWGEAISKSITITAPDNPPAIPQNFQATAGNSLITLSWSANTESDLSHYKIYRSPTHGFSPTVNDLLATVYKPNNNYVDNNVTNGVTYYYRISAVDGSGNESGFSEEVSGLPISTTIFTKITTGDIVNDGGWNQGCGWIDINNDGFLDLFVANYRNQGEADNLLYLNNKNRTFTKIANDIIVTDRSTITATCWGDYNNDGYIDLFEAKSKEDKNSLYFNNGNGTFRKITTGGIVNEGGHSYGACCGDYDNDGDLDIFVAKGFGENNCLYSNNGDGTFTKVTSGIVVNDGGQSCDASFVDYDNDGDLDLFVCNWENENDFLYKNNGDGTFTKIVTGDIVNDGSYSEGNRWGDYDNDGDLDLFVANWNNQKNLLYSNNGDGTFTKILNDPLVNDVGYFASGNWGDFDNDGDLDLVLIKQESNCLYSNNGDGTFTKFDTTPISSEGEFTSGSTWGDYDNDGDLDLFCANTSNQNNYLYSNNGNSNHWINIKCVGTKSNVSAIGTKIRVKANINGKYVWQLNEISGTGGRFGFNSLNAEFGVGNAAVIDSIKIEWTSGIIQILTNVAVNQFLTITEPSDDKTPPNKPTMVQAIPNDGSVTLSWSANTESDLSRYKIYRSQIQGFIPATNNSLSVVFKPNTSYIDQAVTNGQTYYYRISAVDNSGNESGYSNEVSAKPQATINLPTIFVSESSHNFGDVPVFSSSSWGFIIENKGSANLVVNNIECNNNVFTVASSQFTLAPNNQRTIQVQFKPDSVKSESGKLKISSNDPAHSEIFVTLTGKGIDNQAPEIFMQALTQAVWINSNCQVSAQVTDNWKVAKSILYYRTGLDNIFKNVDMSQVQSNVYNAAIPASSITFYGLAYFVKAEDSASHITYSDTLSQEIYFPDDYFTTSDIKSAYQTGYPRGEWRMISVPALLNNPKINNVLFDETELKGYGAPNWKLFSYEDTNSDAITDSNLEYSSNLESSIFRFTTGKAFWFKANEEGEKIVLDVSAGQILALEPMAITLKPGWNQIGNPFAFPIAFTPVHAQIVDKLYMPNGTGGYQLTTTIQPWAGYFVYVNGTQSVNLECVPKFKPTVAKTTTDEMDWEIQLIADCNESKDEINYFGVSSYCSDGWDKKDYPEPPVIGDYISVYFPHKEWQESCECFTSDIKNEIGAGQVWDFQVETNQKSSRVTLRWSSIKEPGSDLKIELFDVSRNRNIDMRSVNEYSYFSSDRQTQSQFKIFVGNEKFVDEQLNETRSQIPERLCLHQNFPNPFNPTTTISFDLPERNFVKLSILDVLGKEVETILSQELDSGRHQVLFDAKNLSSGLYLYRLEAGGFVEVKKLVVLK